jgi:hypothetical protein
VRKISQHSSDLGNKSKTKRFGFESETGSIVRIKNLSQTASSSLTKHQAQDAIRHLA